MSALRATSVAALTAAVVAIVPAAASAATPTRDADPVVLTGAQAPALLGAAPGRVLAFRWTSRGFRQLPVQVDERATVNFGQIYGGTRTGVPFDVYTDPSTFTGADPDPALDKGDEIAFMYRDAGTRRAPARQRPTGVRKAPSVALRLRDPVTKATRYAYLFVASATSTRTPAAGTRYVDYRFALDSGAYRATYKLRQGPNPEHSTVTTKAWSARFSDRWTFDELRLRTTGANRADILDRATNQFAPRTCGRSEKTFNSGEGAFIANVNGPVRAIRSYIGANSGPLTERDHVMYDQRQEIRTFLRVHAIPGVMDLLDYSPATLGMTYRNTNNTGGVTVDGRPDTLATGFSPWEQVSGAPGTLTSVFAPGALPAGVSSTSYRLDQLAPPASLVILCTGDGDALGMSGAWLNSAIPNTDPMRGTAATVRPVRTLYADPPGGGAKLAAARAADVARPVTVSAGRLR